MKSFFLRNLWLWKCGLPEVHLGYERIDSEVIEETWFPEFIRLMRDRIRFGTYRYGSFLDPMQAPYDRVSSAIERIRAYQKNGNLECLADAANLLGIEFTIGKHPSRHFHSVDDGHHVEVSK
jgi:hypothetical protein